MVVAGVLVTVHRVNSAASPSIDGPLIDPLSAKAHAIPDAADCRWCNRIAEWNVILSDRPASDGGSSSYKNHNELRIGHNMEMDECHSPAEGLLIL